MNTSVMFSSATDQWATPQEFFDRLHGEFHFELDACADETNHKCEMYFDREADGLSQEWDRTTWCNPPYGKEIGKWVAKAAEQSEKHRVTVVMLLPARTDTRWFHDYIYGKAEIRFVKGRLKFGGSRNPAPFPSMIVIFRGGRMPELKPCPFCGGKAFVYKRYGSAWRLDPTDFTVLCEECRAGVRHYFSTEAEAIEAWNRRADNATD